MAKRLLPLSKGESLRPIGIGETLKRLMCKAVVEATSDEVKERAGARQFGAGMKGGVEAAIHLMKRLMEKRGCADRADGQTEATDESKGTQWENRSVGVLLMDAENAFNRLNRAHALREVRVHWPSASQFIHNVYAGHASFIIQGSDVTLLSREDVTQG
eukprot:GHVN01046344.1.p1 GENE.GHVN01046344.1~~GHVN01046344.1.p1  ORF type:complete len:159 (-),score=15.39 GHVN01046344.1:37-513(-)